MEQTLPVMQLPATMVILMRLSHAIDRRLCFNFFPTAPFHISETRVADDGNNNFMNSHLFIPRGNGAYKKAEISAIAKNFASGTIISLSDSGAMRGLTSSRLRAHHINGFLKNNLSINICVPRGNEIVSMNAKLSRCMIHTCGVKTNAEALRIGSYILDVYYRDLTDRIAHITALPEAVRVRTLKLTDAFRGARVDRHYLELVVVTITAIDWARAQELKADENTISVTITHSHRKELSGVFQVPFIRVKWLLQQKDIDVKRKRHCWIRIAYEEPIPATTSHHLLLPPVERVVFRKGAAAVDNILLQTMLRPYADFDSWEGWVNCCGLLLQATYTAPQPEPVIVDTRSCLVNCKLDLPFSPSLVKFAQFFQRTGQVVKYDNQDDGYVSVYFTYEPSDTICRKRKDGDAVEIMVFSSGKTNISGPSISINQLACDRFLHLALMFQKSG